MHSDINVPLLEVGHSEEEKGKRRESTARTTSPRYRVSTARGHPTPRTTEPEKNENEEKKELMDILAIDPSALDEEGRRDQEVYAWIYEGVKLIVEDYRKTGNANMVLCQLFLNALQDINSQAQTAKIDIGVQLWYLNTDAVGFEGDISDWSDKSKVWKPAIDFIGDIDMEAMIEDGGSFYIREEFSKYGICNWYQRYKGNISLDLDLHEFPFDRQTIRIKLGATLWSAAYISLKNYTKPDQVDLFTVGMNLTEWDLVAKPVVKDLIEFQVEDSRAVSFMELTIKLRRCPEYYLTHIVLLVFLINVMTWTVYLCGNQLSNRLSLDITLFLALVALNFVAVGFIPKVSYGTKLTEYFVVSYICITFSTLQNVVSFLISTFYCINGYDPWDLPPANSTATAHLAVPGTCNTAFYFDLASLALVALAEIIYTTIFLVLGRKVKPGEIIVEQHKRPDSPSPAEEEHVKVD